MSIVLIEQQNIPVLHLQKFGQLFSSRAYPKGQDIAQVCGGRSPHLGSVTSVNVLTFMTLF